MATRKEQQQISSIYKFGQLSRVETVEGSEMNISASKVPFNAYDNPGDYDLEATFEEGKFPSLRIVKRDDKR